MSTAPISDSPVFSLAPLTWTLSFTSRWISPTPGAKHTETSPVTCDESMPSPVT